MKSYTLIDVMKRHLEQIMIINRLWEHDEKDIIS